MVKSKLSRTHRFQKRHTSSFRPTRKATTRRQRKHARGGGRQTIQQHTMRPSCAVPATAPVVPNCIPDVDVSAFKAPCKALTTSPLFAPFPCASATPSIVKGGVRRKASKRSKRSKRRIR